MGYITYENKNNPHITIHIDFCNQIRKNGGEGLGEYKEHKTLEAARNYSQTTGLPIRECKFCMRED
jgi:hypothetical protein